MSLSGTVFIDRANRETAVKAFLDGAAREMQEFRQKCVQHLPRGNEELFGDSGVVALQEKGRSIWRLRRVCLLCQLFVVGELSSCVEYCRKLHF